MVAGMSAVFDGLVGQDAVVAELLGAARSPERMTHAWLITGPAGSGRSVAARAFAAALQCETPGAAGCGACHACTTVLAGTHSDVTHVVPEGLSIGVDQMRAMVRAASRRPAVGRWQVVVVEDADRLTEQSANALLKAVEEPPARTVFVLCAPSDDPEDIAITLRSRCRRVALTTPSVAAIAEVLVRRDGLDAETAQWAAGVCGGHIGRARRLASSAESRAEREQALSMARAALKDSVYGEAEQLVAAAKASAKASSEERDAVEIAELKTAMGAGGTGRGAAGATRGMAGAVKELERRQRSRATRSERDALDRALVDLAALFRDALAASYGADVASMHPDQAEQAQRLGGYATPAELLRCVEAVLTCRQALAENVKPKFAVDAMAAGLSLALRR